MVALYSCARCSKVFPEAHLIGYVCPQCGQAFESKQVAAIARTTRWTHVLIVTGIIGLLGGMSLGLFVAKSMELKVPTGGYVALGITAVVTVIVGFGVRAYDHWRNG